jgi:hypothetical protein
VPEIRRFPLPWTIHEGPSAYWVECADGKRFAFTYFYEGKSIDSLLYNRLTRAEALVIVRNIVKLPEYTRK